MSGRTQEALAPELGLRPQVQDEETHAQIRALAARIDPGDSGQVAAYGTRTQQAFAALSDMALQRMLEEDIRPLCGMMQALAEQVRGCSFAAQAGGLLARLTDRAPSLAQVREAYDRAQPRISALEGEMMDRRAALMRDGAMLERLYARNEVIYRELCSLLAVGEEALRMAGAQRGEALERRVQDLCATLAASTQLAAQIRLVQRSGSLTCEQLRTALEVTIPLWRSQMVAALGMARATESMRMGRRARQEAGRGIRHGAALCEGGMAAGRQGAVEGEAAHRQLAEEAAQQLLAELTEMAHTLSGLQERLSPKGGRQA